MSEAPGIVPARRETLVAPSPRDRVGRFTLAQLSVVQSRPRRTALVASHIGMLEVARIPTMISGTTTRGSGVHGGGQWAVEKRR